MSRLASLFIGKEKDPEQPNVHEGVEAGKTTYKILFVDDEDNVLKAMRRIFRQENYTILTASSGDEALKLLEKEPVHIVISDHRMPGMTGADLLRNIKELYPQTIRIMLTGHADVNAIMGAVNEGAVYKFITKPWNDDDLRLTVSLALEKYDLIQENKALKEQREAQKKKIKQLSRFVNVNRSQLGRMLLRKKLIQKEDLDKAIAVQAKTNKILPRILIDMGIVDEATIMKTIQSETGINRVYPNEFTVPKELALLIPKEICEKNLLVPLKRADGRLIVAMADPTDYMKTDDLKFIAGAPIQPVLCTEKEITDKLQELFGEANIVEEVISEIDMSDPYDTIEIILDEEDEETDVDELLRAKDQPPAVRIVNAIVSEALRHNASDVHIEPKTKNVMVRFRIDGLLHDKINIPLAMHASIVSRIKVICELDIAERRRPQDGRVTVKTSSRMVDMRISTLPTITGEKVVLRILDKNAAIRDIGELGVSDSDLVKLVRLVSQPQGVILSTGPTGSGKTTTLYSLLRHVATTIKNFTTIEDPVEYYMSMAEQVLVREKIGLRFPDILRALLRQDPDVIMLGEIRDFETAEVALHAAMTGHLVLSTLHTNSAIASITRLRDLGIKPYVINEALTGIIAQRLVRRICPHCKVDDDPPQEVLHALRLDKKTLDITPQKGAGCQHCNQTGYTGRIGIFEVFQVDEGLKKMIYRDAGQIELLRAAQWSGMSTLLEDAIDKVRKGITTCEEVLRILGPQNTLEIACPQCGVRLEERFQFCPFCGGAIIPCCAGCGKFLTGTWETCPYCGEKVVIGH
ncbi:MAG: Flp pilus assembly complex ATPase component TadA [Deltaproteobacteria bacterium]|nr:Flp pilus assembly complex ATPase component TadA [Deltaproteobacteria bacterium]